MNTLESGRSMLEMLDTLTIMGILSITELQFIILTMDISVSDLEAVGQQLSILPIQPFILGLWMQPKNHVPLMKQKHSEMMILMQMGQKYCCLEGVKAMEVPQIHTHVIVKFTLLKSGKRMN